MGRKYKRCKRKKYSINKWRTHQRGNNQTPFIDHSLLKLEIKESALEKLQSYRQIEGPELCGVFTGSEIENSMYRIGKISDPCIIINDSSKHGCTRDAVLANHFIQQDYEVSNHSRYYLGEWHTHPEDTPTPSATDIASIKDVYSKSELPIHGLFLIIVGMKSNYYGFYDGYNLHEIGIDSLRELLI